MIKFTDKQIIEIQDIWERFWIKGDRKNIYTKIIADALRQQGYGLADLQEIIAVARTTKPNLRTPAEVSIVACHKNIKLEADTARNEDLVCSTQGLKFLQMAQNGYSEKKIVEVTSDLSLDDIIKQNQEGK